MNYRGPKLGPLRKSVNTAPDTSHRKPHYCNILRHLLRARFEERAAPDSAIGTPLRISDAVAVLE